MKIFTYKKVKILVTAICDMPKVLYAAQECKRVLANYRKSYLNTNKHSKIK